MHVIDTFSYTVIFFGILHALCSFLLRNKSFRGNDISVCNTNRGSVGNWRNYRNMLDVSGPLGLDGKLRGRGVLTWQNSHHFYNTAHDDNKIAYGVLEADLTPKTLLTVGGSYTRYRGVPWSMGLMVYQDGRDPHLPRSTAWTYPWEKADSDTKEVFAGLEQKFGEHWDAKLNYTHLEQTNFEVDASPSGVIPQDGSSVGIYSAANRSKNTQDSLDFTLNGQVDVLGLPQKMTFGSNWSAVSTTRAKARIACN